MSGRQVAEAFLQEHEPDDKHDGADGGLVHDGPDERDEAEPREEDESDAVKETLAPGTRDARSSVDVRSRPWRKERQTVTGGEEGGKERGRGRAYSFVVYVDRLAIIDHASLRDGSTVPDSNRDTP